MQCPGDADGAEAVSMGPVAVAGFSLGFGVLSVVFGPASTAQTSKLHPGGIVSGHVTCADTNTPARLAMVVLLPVGLAGQGHASSPPAQAQTDFNGEYSIANVMPGRYLVQVSLAGYLSPGAEQVAEVEDALRAGKPVPPEFTVVEINEGAEATTQSVALERGGSVTGTVLYDDGGPAIGAHMTALLSRPVRGLEGRQVMLPIGPGAVTDTQGRYRLDGLWPGAYAVEARLAAITQRITRVVRVQGGDLFFGPPTPEIRVDYGDVFWRRDAKLLEVHAADQVEADLTIPLSRLGRLTGRVSAADGHLVGAGAVSIAPAGDAADSRMAEIGADGAFIFDELPEGTYKIEVSGAADLAEEGAVDGGAPRFVEARRYGSAKTTVTVRGAATNVQLTVPAGK